jgi:hypothetical protein
MRVPKVCVVSVLITICALLAGGNAQTSNPRTGPEAINGQDANPKPSNSGAHTAPATPNSANNPGQAAPGKISNGPSPARPATPTNPATAGQNSTLATAAPQSQAPIPQNVLFELFFNNMRALNKAAESDDKAGDHISAEAWRRHDQEAAGLNDAEGDILREIVLDCLRELKVQDAKFRALAEKERAQMTPGVIRPASAELAQIFEGRKKILSDHIEKLREALGDTSFNKLDAYIHSTFHAQVIEPKPASSSITAIEKSKKERQ